MLVGHRETADVEAVASLAAGAVDATEHEAGVAQLQGGEPVGDAPLDHLPLPAGLLRAALADLHHRAQPSGIDARALQALVGTIDVGLLSSKVRMRCHRPPQAEKRDRPFYLSRHPMRGWAMLAR